MKVLHNQTNGAKVLFWKISADQAVDQLVSYPERGEGQ